MLIQIISLALLKIRNMKATINVKKGSSFAKYNGQTFIVDPAKFLTIKGKILVPIRGLNPEYPSNYTDFMQDELIFSNEKN